MLNIRNKKFEVKFIGVSEKHSHEFINGKIYYAIHTINRYGVMIDRITIINNTG